MQPLKHNILIIFIHFRFMQIVVPEASFILVRQYKNRRKIISSFLAYLFSSVKNNRKVRYFLRIFLSPRDIRTFSIKI